MAKRLVQPAQAIQIGDNQFLAGRRLKPLTRQGDEAAPIWQPCQIVQTRGGEANLCGDHAGRSPAFLKPDAAPDAGLTATHPQPHKDFAARVLHTKDFLSGGAILRQGESPQGCG